MSRSKKYMTDEERKEAQRTYRKTAKLKTKNITIVAQLVEALNGTADSLKDTLGFRPSISETLHYMLKQLP